MSTPNPTTTPWVPMWSLQQTGIDLRYQGDYVAGSYADGDIVVMNGVTYLCVRPTTAAPVPWTPPQLSPTYGTSFPANPVDGQEHILVDSVSSPTYHWRFRYNAGHTVDAYKWELIGGTHAFSAGSSSATPTSSTWIDAGGPSFTLPRDGVYDFEWGCAYAYVATDNAYSVCMGPKTPSMTNPSTPWYVNSGVPAPATHRWTYQTVAGLSKAQYNLPGTASGTG